MGRRFQVPKVTSAYTFNIYIKSLELIIFRYFGRAKDLPGVRELFQSRKKEEEEENQVLAHYKRFMNQGPAYYGDLDEADGKLLTYELEAEKEGKVVLYVKAGNLT